MYQVTHGSVPSTPEGARPSPIAVPFPRLDHTTACEPSAALAGVPESLAVWDTGKEAKKPPSIRLGAPMPRPGDRTRRSSFGHPFSGSGRPDHPLRRPNAPTCTPQSPPSTYLGPHPPAAAQDLRLLPPSIPLPTHRPPIYTQSHHPRPARRSTADLTSARSSPVNDATSCSPAIPSLSIASSVPTATLGVETGCDWV